MFSEIIKWVIGLFFIWVLISIYGCKEGQRFNPDFHVFSNGGLVNEIGNVVPYDIAVDNFACMSKAKIVELKLLLQNTQPMKSRNAENFTGKELDKIIRRLRK